MPHHTRRGAAAVELAVLLPFLLFLAVVSADWARLLYFTIAVETCARSGALVLSDETNWKQSPANPNVATPYPAGFCAAGTPALSAAEKAVVEGAARAESPNLTPAPVVSATHAIDSASNATVSVTVTRPFTAIVRFPGVPTAETVSRTVTMRVAPQATK
jgi:Flp pilus assembly protein TadG